MTTTVCDRVNNIVTADTRWSTEQVLSDEQKYLIFCDTTGFDKIATVGKASLIVAGNGILIARWKEWWLNDRSVETTPQTKIDGVHAISIAIIDMQENEVLFDAGVKSILYCPISDAIKAFTSGSGMHHAAASLYEKSCAKNAILDASLQDKYTSAIVKFVCGKTGENNLETPIFDYTEIINGICKQGFMMNMNNENVAVPINEHPLGKEVVERFSTGQAVASAPVPGLGSFEWTEKTDQKLAKAMERVRELEAM